MNRLLPIGITSSAFIFEALFALVEWYGLDVLELLEEPLQNRADVHDFDDDALWRVDPDACIDVNDLLDEEALLDLAGCLDADVNELGCTLG